MPAWQWIRRDNIVTSWNSDISWRICKSLSCHYVQNKWVYALNWFALTIYLPVHTWEVQGFIVHLNWLPTLCLPLNLLLPYEYHSWSVRKTWYTQSPSRNCINPLICNANICTYLRTYKHNGKFRAESASWQKEKSDRSLSTTIWFSWERKTGLKPATLSLEG